MDIYEGCSEDAARKGLLRRCTISATVETPRANRFRVFCFVLSAWRPERARRRFRFIDLSTTVRVHPPPHPSPAIARTVFRTRYTVIIYIPRRVYYEHGSVIANGEIVIIRDDIRGEKPRRRRRHRLRPSIVRVYDNNNNTRATNGSATDAPRASPRRVIIVPFFLVRNNEQILPSPVRIAKINFSSSRAP